MNNHHTSPISIDAPGPRKSDQDISNLHAHYSGFHDEGHPTSINILPDDVLLVIFQFDGLDDDSDWCFWWCRLTHVCRRWRTVVFGSPNFLDLKLVCGLTTRSELIDIWPPFPIVIRNVIDLLSPRDRDNFFLIDAAVEHRSRVHEIKLSYLSMSDSSITYTSGMRKTFPALTHLYLHCEGEPPLPALPDRFLGGSVPLLESFTLDYIPFPALPKFLFSATNLVDLELLYIPDIERILPEIVASLAVLANLKSLSIALTSGLSRLDPESRPPPPLNRSVLPALKHFNFQVTSHYLEDFLARIDAPLLYSIEIEFLDEHTFNTPQLAQFIGRTPMPETSEAHLCCYNSCVGLEFPSSGFIELRTPYQKSVWGPSFLMSTLPPLSTVERLYFRHRGPSSIFENHSSKNAEWLELFGPFTALKELHFLSEGFKPFIVPVLQALVGERVTEVLPFLQDIFLPEFELSRPIKEAIQQSVTARQLSGHPLTVRIGDTSVG